MALDLSRTAIIDFEASGLPAKGYPTYPIEVALGFPDSGDIQSWLIRPEPDWLDQWAWSMESERVHGLSQAHLIAEGLSRAEALHAFDTALGSRVLFSDCPSFDQYWLWVFAGCGDRRQPIGDIDALLGEIAGRSMPGRAMLSLAYAKAERDSPPTHRAGDDVRHWMVAIAELQRLAAEE